MMRQIQVIATSVALTALTGHSALPLLDNFETETIGEQPTNTASIVRPQTNSVTAFTKVVGPSTNPAGTGNGVQMYDNESADVIGVTALEYNFVASSNDMVSLVRVDFDVSYTGDFSNDSNCFHVGFGAYNPDVTINAKTNRWNELRLYGDGTLNWIGGSKGDTPITNMSHTITMFANDTPDTVGYIGLVPGETNVLGGDSIACWLDGELRINAMLDNDYDIHSSTNNFGKFGIASGTSTTNLSYVFDNIELSEYAVYEIRLFIDCHRQPLYADFENDLPGYKTGTTPLELQRPFNNHSNCFTKVVDSSVNTAGTGNGYQMFDDAASESAPDNITCLEFNFVDSTDDQVSAVRVDLDFAYVTTDSTTNGVIKPIHFGLGEYNDLRSFYTSANRYTDARFYPDGTIDFRRNSIAGAEYNPGPWDTITNYPESQDHVILPGANELIMFANDWDTDFVDYTGPDGKIYSLPTNSAAYWLNGEVVMMVDDDDTNAYIILDIYDWTSSMNPYPGVLYQRENDFGKVGFNSESDAVNLNYVFDNIQVTTNLLYIVDSWEKWLAQYPMLAVITDIYIDDGDEDGMDNVTECALDGDPTVSDADTVLPKYFVSTENGTNWLNYVYNRRIHRDSFPLTYDVLSGTNLMSLTAPTEEAGVGEINYYMESVTNRVPMDTLDVQFMKLDIELY